MSSQESNFKEKIEFEYAIKQRNFEIENFWKRSWFFGVLVIAEITALYTVKLANNTLTVQIISFIACITLLAQCLMNRGSKFWQERWEYISLNREKALEIELTRLKHFDDVELNRWLNEKYTYNNRNEWFFIDASILSKGENVITASRRFSVSKITFLVWDIIFLCATLNWINESITILTLKPDWNLTLKLSVFYFTLFVYIYFFFKNGKVYEPYAKELLKMNEDEVKDIEVKYMNNDITSPFKFIINERS